MDLRLSQRRMVFIVGCVVFLFVGVFVDWLLLVGCAIGVFGGWFVFPLWVRFTVERKIVKLERLKKEIVRLEKDVGK